MAGSVNDAVSEAMATDGLDPTEVFSETSAPAAVSAPAPEAPPSEEVAPEGAVDRVDSATGQRVGEEAPSGAESPAEKPAEAPSVQNIIGERDRLRAENARLREVQDRVDARLRAIEQATYAQRSQREPARQRSLADIQREVVEELKQQGYTDEQLRDPFSQRYVKTEAMARHGLEKQEAAERRIARQEESALASQNEARVARAIAASPALTRLISGKSDIEEQVREVVFARWSARYDEGETAEKAVAWFQNLLESAVRSAYTAAQERAKERATGPRPIVKAGGAAPSLARAPKKPGQGIKNLKDAVGAIKRDFGVDME